MLMHFNILVGVANQTREKVHDVVLPFLKTLKDDFWERFELLCPNAPLVLSFQALQGKVIHGCGGEVKTARRLMFSKTLKHDERNTVRVVAQ